MKNLILVNYKGIVKVDDEDYDRFFKLKWYNTNGYVTTVIKGKTRYLHRLILNLKPEDKVYVDHIDFNRFDCRKKNLRICSSKESAEHRRGYKKVSYSSKFKGVSWQKQKGMWQVRYKKQWGGLFISEISAAKKYNEMAKKNINQFTILNSI